MTAEIADQSLLVPVMRNQLALIQQQLDHARAEASAKFATYVKERQVLLLELAAVQAAKRRLETKLLFATGHLAAAEIAATHMPRVVKTMREP